jgi:hypothetical protein
MQVFVARQRAGLNTKPTKHTKNTKKKSERTTAKKTNQAHDLAIRQFLLVFFVSFVFLVSKMPRAPPAFHQFTPADTHRIPHQSPDA